MLINIVTFDDTWFEVVYSCYMSWWFLSSRSSILCFSIMEFVLCVCYLKNIHTKWTLDLNYTETPLYYRYQNNLDILDIAIVVKGSKYDVKQLMNFIKIVCTSNHNLENNKLEYL